MKHNGLKRSGFKPMIFSSVFLFFILICVSAFAADIKINMETIAWIESRNQPGVVSNKGCVGLYQIGALTLIDYNIYNRTNYARQDLFNPEINFKIADWYLHKRIPKMLKHYEVPDTLEHRLIAYNWGIGNLVKLYNKVSCETTLYSMLPEETQNYIKMYYEAQI